MATQSIQLYNAQCQEILGGTDTMVFTSRYTPYVSVAAFLKGGWIERAVSVARNIKHQQPVRVKVITSPDYDTAHDSVFYEATI